MTRRTMATAVAAVLGIAVSAVLAWEASQLAGQRVGLASEPLSVATYLSPATRSLHPHAAPRRSDDHPAAKRTVTVTSSASGSAAASPAGPVTPVAPTATATVTAAPPPAATTATRPAAAPTSTARAAGATLRAGHHGDGGDQHDD